MNTSIKRAVSSPHFDESVNALFRPAASKALTMHEQNSYIRLWHFACVVLLYAFLFSKLYCERAWLEIRLLWTDVQEWLLT